MKNIQSKNIIYKLIFIFLLFFFLYLIFLEIKNNKTIYTKIINRIEFDNQITNLDFKTNLINSQKFIRNQYLILSNLADPIARKTLKEQKIEEYVVKIGILDDGFILTTFYYGKNKDAKIINDKYIEIVIEELQKNNKKEINISNKTTVAYDYSINFNYTIFIIIIFIYLYIYTLVFKEKLIKLEKNTNI